MTKSFCGKVNVRDGDRRRFRESSGGAVSPQFRDRKDAIHFPFEMPVSPPQEDTTGVQMSLARSLNFREKKNLLS